jgi:hypothetical protein
MLDWAPRSLEAATMFIALVICWVFFTAFIFNWISFKVAIPFSLCNECYGLRLSSCGLNGAIASTAQRATHNAVILSCP